MVRRRWVEVPLVSRNGINVGSGVITVGSVGSRHGCSQGYHLVIGRFRL